VVTIINKSNFQIKTPSLKEGKVYKLSKIRQKLAGYGLSKRESLALLKFLKKLGYIEFCKPGYVRVFDSRLIEFLEQKNKS